MGNNCCRQQDEGDVFVVDPPAEMEDTRSYSAAQSNHLYSQSTDPQFKMEEYYEILREMQTDSLEKMRHQLKNKPEIFLLNNLVLSIQFFDNFERYRYHSFVYLQSRRKRIQGTLKYVTPLGHCQITARQILKALLVTGAS